jgi:DNA-binding IscR family transcriptional regulator
VEALLLVFERAPAAVPAADVAARAQLRAPARLARTMEELAAAGLVEGDAGGGYRFAPRLPALGDAVRLLARAYNEKPVTLVTALYARPADPARAFADAFRLRSDEP